MLPKYKEIVDLIKKGSTLEAQEQIMALREGALELQEENQELKSRIRELENRLSTADEWAIEKIRYALVNPWQGPAQVYALKESAAEGEEAHYLCTNCFHNKTKAILNPGKRDTWVVMNCPKCRASLETNYKGIGKPEYVEKINKES